MKNDRQTVRKMKTLDVMAAHGHCLSAAVNLSIFLHSDNASLPLAQNTFVDQVVCFKVVHNLNILTFTF